MEETIAELRQNIEEAYLRFRVFIEDPELEWSRDLGDEPFAPSLRMY